MAINLTTDIVSDVMNAGDPAVTGAATERLSRLQPSSAADFEAQAAAASAAAGTDTHLRAELRVALPASDKPIMSRPAEAGGDAAGTVYRKFEAFVLQTFVESMLPHNDQIFGKGTAGNVWRSMLAEQLGTQLAKSGGVGIARVLANAQLRATDAIPAVDPDL